MNFFRVKVLIIFSILITFVNGQLFSALLGLGSGFRALNSLSSIPSYGTPSIGGLSVPSSGSGQKSVILPGLVIDNGNVIGSSIPSGANPAIERAIIDALKPRESANVYQRGPQNNVQNVRNPAPAPIQRPSFRYPSIRNSLNSPNSNLKFIGKQSPNTYSSIPSFSSYGTPNTGGLSVPSSGSNTPRNVILPGLVIENGKVIGASGPYSGLSPYNQYLNNPYTAQNIGTGISQDYTAELTKSIMEFTVKAQNQALMQVNAGIRNQLNTLPTFFGR